jgi:hypothetical protein
MLCYCWHCTYVNKLIVGRYPKQKRSKSVFTIFTIYNQKMHNIFSTYWSLKTLLRVSVNALSSSSGISFYFAKVTSRGSVVGIVTRIRTVWSRNHGSIPGKGQEIFLFSKTLSLAHPTSYTVGTGSSFSGVKYIVPKLGMRGSVHRPPPPYPLMYRDTRSCNLMYEYRRYRESTKETGFDR